MPMSLNSKFKIFLLQPENKHFLFDSRKEIEVSFHPIIYISQKIIINHKPTNIGQIALERQLGQFNSRAAVA